ncbi:hypothetical protein NMY22_g8153 [Coprinellus aureogranulatus]|nr:hypothetical protein NMY22_g8153 [Coprinellus aureogranulatus]
MPLHSNVNWESGPPRYGTSAKIPTSETSNDHVPSALTLGPRKKPNLQTDPLVHHGRHFGRTVYAFANMHALLIAGLGADEDTPPETQQADAEYQTTRERRELRVFKKLLSMIPGFEERLMATESEEEIMAVASMVGVPTTRGLYFAMTETLQLQKGAASARSDDTKSLKGPILDWITPVDGPPLAPPLSRSAKQNRGFHHERTGFLLCPAELDWSQDEFSPVIKKQLRNKELTVAGSHWPIFVYKGEKFNPDDPWMGLFRNELLIKGFKHIFTSPSSVDDEPKATRSGNARIHGMSHVTPASLSYVATQIRFALSSAGVFSRTDRETDSETFYTSILELLEDPEEQDEVKPLLLWWNQRIFPSFSTARRLAPTTSALAKIKEKRRANAQDLAHMYMYIYPSRNGDSLELQRKRLSRAAFRLIRNAFARAGDTVQLPDQEQCIRTITTLISAGVGPKTAVINEPFIGKDTRSGHQLSRNDAPRLQIREIYLMAQRASLARCYEGEEKGNTVFEAPEESAYRESSSSCTIDEQRIAAQMREAILHSRTTHILRIHRRFDLYISDDERRKETRQTTLVKAYQPGTPDQEPPRRSCGQMLGTRIKAEAGPA